MHPVLGTQRLCLVPKHFHHPERKRCPLSSPSPFPTPSCLGTTRPRCLRLCLRWVIPCKGVIKHAAFRGSFPGRLWGSCLSVSAPRGGRPVACWSQWVHPPVCARWAFGRFLPSGCRGCRCCERSPTTWCVAYVFVSLGHVPGVELLGFTL